MADIKQIVRVAKVDIHGNKGVAQALTKIKGIGISFSTSICNHLNINQNIKIGALSESQLKQIEQTIENPKGKLPDFLLNRKRHYETGENKQLVTSDLKLTQEFDIKRLKKTKSYKGMRHAWGLPVRGQKTKAHFRKGKTVGVKKKSKISKKN